MATKKTKEKAEATERTDLATLTAPDGRQYTNADHSMIGEVVVCLKGYEDSFTLITDEEAEGYKVEKEEGRENGNTDEE